MIDITKKVDDFIESFWLDWAFRWVQDHYSLDKNIVEDFIKDFLITDIKNFDEDEFIDIQGYEEYYKFYDKYIDSDKKDLVKNIDLFWGYMDNIWSIKDWDSYYENIVKWQDTAYYHTMEHIKTCLLFELEDFEEIEDEKTNNEPTKNDDSENIKKITETFFETFELTEWLKFVWNHYSSKRSIIKDFVMMNLFEDYNNFKIKSIKEIEEYNDYSDFLEDISIDDLEEVIKLFSDFIGNIENKVDFKNEDERIEYYQAISEWQYLAYSAALTEIKEWFLKHIKNNI